jgi:hypothetical protein
VLVCWGAGVLVCRYAECTDVLLMASDNEEARVLQCMQQMQMEFLNSKIGPILLRTRP